MAARLCGPAAFSGDDPIGPGERVSQAPAQIVPLRNSVLRSPPRRGARQEPQGGIAIIQTIPTSDASPGPKLRIAGEGAFPAPRIFADHRGARVGAPGHGELGAELELLRADNAALKMEVEHLRRRDEHVNRAMAEIDEELRLAARLQRDFLPRAMPAVGATRFSSLFRPAGYVSGDLYDVQQLDEQHVGFYVGDAVGHGMPAALLTMFMRHSLKMKEVGRSSYRLLNPSETLNRLNLAMLDQELSSSTFATAVCGVINAFTGRYVISGAGHPAPMVVPGDDSQPRFIEVEGPLLGVSPEPGFIDVAGTLGPGERLVLYSDGVEVIFPTAITSASQRNFDDTRWQAELLSAREGTAQDMIDALAAAMDGHEGSLAPGDDLTVLVVEMD